MNIRFDLVAGLSIAGLLLPESIAYSSIAGLAPQHALFAAIVGMFIYAAAGRSQFAVVAPTSSSAAILGAAVATVVSDTGAADREALAFGAVCLTGVFFLVAGAFRLGALSNFISRPVLRGFAFGLAITIVCKQLPVVLAVGGVSGNPFQILWALAEKHAQWNLPSAVMGVSALAALIALKRFPALPAAFAVLAAGVAIAYGMDLSAQGVKLVGAIDVTPDRPGLPNLDWRTWTRLGEVAAPLFLIVFAESWGSMRNLALRHNETLDPNRELIALGLANLGSGLVRGMPIGAGFSASSANEAAGARTRAAGVVGAIAMIVMVALGGALIARIPEPVLAAIVIAALAHALDPAPLIRLWKIDRDQYVALAAALGVMIFGVVDGMLLAVALSVAFTIERMARPKVATLGRLRDTHDFVDTTNPDAVVDPNILVVRPSQPLFFANAEPVFNQIAAQIAADPQARAIILSLEETSALDSTVLEALMEFDKRQQAAGRTLYLARVKDSIIHTLERAGADRLASKECRHWSVAGAWDEAVLKLSGESGVTATQTPVAPSPPHA
ncbi:MAG: SulP family inorganic anion transporter [Hyphomicrobiales bacterium]|nr:SulP family inorganic anion transporter [Hyphomicrobiales bacterium]